MGVHVILDIDPRGIDMYMRSLRRDLDDPRRVCWSVVGDRDSLQTGRVPVALPVIDDAHPS